MRAPFALLLALAGLLLAGGPAHASSSQVMLVEAPRDLTAASATEARRVATFAELGSLGVRGIRVNLRWRDVAPDPAATVVPSGDLTDPAAYAWGNYGPAIDQAKANGWQVLITVSTPAPRWATEGAVDSVTRPSPSEMQRFAAAAARRFGGPTVMWSVMNEPNLPGFLAPQRSSTGLAAPQIYRQLFISARQGIRDAGQTSAKVLFGELAAVGGARDDRRFPLEFLRSALCLTTKYRWDSSCGTLQVDGLAIHPYQLRSGFTPKPDDVTGSTLARLTTFLDRAAKAKAINAKVPVYVTEFGVQSYPDEIFGFSPQRQYEIRARMERLAFYQPRVRSFAQYLMTDDDTNDGFQTGLIYAKTGKPKPAFDAFRLVLDVRKSGSSRSPKASLWGLVRPAQGAVKVTIQRKTGKRFATWRTLKTRSNGSFTVTDRLRKGAQYRYRWVSPAGVAYVSPPSRLLAEQR